MIEKIQPDHIVGLDGLPTTIMPDSAKLMRKINEVIDWINDVSALRVTDNQVTANLPNIDAGELAFLSKENSELKDELDRTRKALDVAIDWLEQVATSAKCDDDLCREFTKRKLTEIKTALEQKEEK